MNIIKPEKLKQGDVIGIISPSSPVSDRGKLG
jgi:muramoyltetrapeptide carboxypeptidase LdcA involved in peptidoglycan recycling